MTQRPDAELLALARQLETAPSSEDYITVQIPIDQRAEVVKALRARASMENGNG